MICDRWYDKDRFYTQSYAEIQKILKKDYGVDMLNKRTNSRYRVVSSSL